MYRSSKNQQKSHVINHFLWVKMQFLLEKICNYQIHHYLMWKVQITFMQYLTHSFLFLSNTWKYNFLIDHHCETKSEYFDSVAFVRIVWCSCRVHSSTLPKTVPSSGGFCVFCKIFTPGKSNSIPKLIFQCCWMFSCCSKYLVFRKCSLNLRQSQWQ